MHHKLVQKFILNLTYLTFWIQTVNTNWFMLSTWYTSFCVHKVCLRQKKKKSCSLSICFSCCILYMYWVSYFSLGLHYAKMSKCPLTRLLFLLVIKWHSLFMFQFSLSYCVSCFLCFNIITASSLLEIPHCMIISFFSWLCN